MDSYKHPIAPGLPVARGEITGPCSHVAALRGPAGRRGEGLPTARGKLRGERRQGLDGGLRQPPGGEDREGEDRFGCGSKKVVPIFGPLDGKKDPNPRNSSSLILSHTHLATREPHSLSSWTLVTFLGLDHFSGE